jgi:hypothetical protein
LESLKPGAELVDIAASHDLAWFTLWPCSILGRLT